MSPILLRASFNFFLRHPWQLFLAILGIALGVAVVVSIALVKNSAEQAFEQSTQAIVGKATHRIIAGPSGLDDAVYTRLRVSHGVRDIAPVVQGLLAVETGSGKETLLLLGIDPFAENRFRNYSISENQSSPADANTMVRLLTEANTAILDRATATRLGLSVGDSLSIKTGAGDTSLELINIVSARSASSVHSLDHLMLTDISTAQELLGMRDKLTRIDLVLPDNEGRTEAEIRALLPAGTELLPASSRNQSLRQMTTAFHTNLTALSLLALLVGMFLIFNTMTFLVMQRRELIGKLRALGVTRKQVFTLISTEALLIGVVASLTGLAAGIMLAQVLLQVVSRTINELYFFLPVSSLTLSPVILIEGIALGIIATLVSALLPALDASRVPPGKAMLRSHLEKQTRRLAGLLSLAGISVLCLGLLVVSVSAKSVASGFAGIFVIIAGFALLTPILTLTFMTIIKPVLSRTLGISGRYACQSVSASLSRTAAAIAALMIAIATVIGIGLMVNNFRVSVNQWLENILRADMYVAVQGPRASGSNFYLDDNLKKKINALPEVTEVSSVRRIQIESEKGLFDLVAYGLNERAYKGFLFRESTGETLWNEFEHSNGAIISEPYAYHHDLRLHDLLPIRTDSGVQTFKVLGIYTDYGSDRGVVSVSRRSYEKYWQDRGYSGLGVYLQPDADADTLRSTIQALAADQDLVIQDRRKILALSLDVFDNTFLITEILRILAVIIAFVSVLSALMALQMERTKEHGLLRALGLLSSQLRALIFTETTLLGLVAGVLAIPVGCAITALLIFVINRRSFGWTMELHILPEQLLQGLALSLLAAMLAGIYPAWRMSRTRAAEAMRTE